MVRKENYKEKKKQNFHWKKCTKKFEWNTMQKKKKKRMVKNHQFFDFNWSKPLLWICKKCIFD